MGIFIRTNAPEPPGTRLNLRFTPPGGPQLSLEGRVMWVNPYRPGSYDNINPGMGVQFIELTAAAARADREPGPHLRVSVRRRRAQGQQLAAPARARVCGYFRSGCQRESAERHPAVGVLEPERVTAWTATSYSPGGSPVRGTRNSPQIIGSS